jgi:hypothetical protein
MPIFEIKGRTRTMEVRTFTNFWNMERKLYAIYDVSLPVPVSLKVVGAFAVVAVPWWGLMILLHIPFANPWYLFWILPPGILGYVASKPIWQKKTIIQYLQSWFRYMSEPKRLAGLREPDYKVDEEYSLTTKIFSRKSQKDM